MEQKDFALLGKTVNEPPVAPDSILIDTFENKHRDRNYVVEFKSSDFTSLCPVTQQSDFAELFIRYIPKEKCIESKSLKYYLQSFRNQKMFNEEIVNRILSDLAGACQPKMMQVKGVFAPRGGIRITAVAEYPSTEPKALLSIME